MRQKKNIKRVHAGKKAALKNKWIQHVSKCRKLRSESFKRGLQTCARTYKKSKFNKFKSEIAMGAFEKGSLY